MVTVVSARVFRRVCVCTLLAETVQQKFSAAPAVDEGGGEAPPELLLALKKAAFHPPPSPRAPSDVPAHSLWCEHL